MKVNYNKETIFYNKLYIHSYYQTTDKGRNKRKLEDQNKLFDMIFKKKGRLMVDFPKLGFDNNNDGIKLDVFTKNSQLTAKITSKHYKSVFIVLIRTYLLFITTTKVYDTFSYLNIHPKKTEILSYGFIRYYF